MGTTTSKGASFKKDLRDFPGIPVVKTPPCNVWASLVAQTVTNLPAVQETWLWSLGWEDPLEEGMATHSSILVRRIHGVTKSQTQLSNFHYALWRTQVQSLVGELRFHMPQKNWACMQQLLRPCATTRESVHCNQRSHMAQPRLHVLQPRSDAPE